MENFYCVECDDIHAPGHCTKCGACTAERGKCWNCGAAL